MQSALRWLRIAARVAIVAIVVVALAGPARQAVRAFRRPVQSGLSYRAEADAWSARFTCMADAIGRLVPAGTDVFIDRSSQAIDGGVWYQRLTEMAFPHHRLVDSPDTARYVLSVETSANPEACSGVRLVVTDRP